MKKCNLFLILSLVACQASVGGLAAMNKKETDLEKKFYEWVESKKEENKKIREREKSEFLGFVLKEPLEILEAFLKSSLEKEPFSPDKSGHNRWSITIAAYVLGKIISRDEEKLGKWWTTQCERYNKKFEREIVCETVKPIVFLRNFLFYKWKGKFDYDKFNSEKYKKNGISNILDIADEGAEIFFKKHEINEDLRKFIMSYVNKLLNFNN